MKDNYVKVAGEVLTDEQATAFLRASSSILAQTVGGHIENNKTITLSGTIDVDEQPTKSQAARSTSKKQNVSKSVSKKALKNFSSSPYNGGERDIGDYMSRVVTQITLKNKAVDRLNSGPPSTGKRQKLRSASQRRVSSVMGSERHSEPGSNVYTENTSCRARS